MSEQDSYQILSCLSNTTNRSIQKLKFGTCGN